MASNTKTSKPQETLCPNRLKGKVALITGGAKGIGRAIALRFAQEGADIAIADIDSAAMISTDKEIGALGRKCMARQTNVANRDDVATTVQAVIDQFLTIDILVNNAGIILFGSILDCTPGEWKQMLDVDLTGAFYCTQIVGQHMKTNNVAGRLIHIGSTASLLPTAQQGAYCVAKAGLRMISRMAALELGPLGITSNLLCPEGAVTDMNRELLSDPQVMHQLESKIPAGRFGTVEEIAAAAAFLASDEAAYVNGAELVQDGGITISPLWWR